MAFRGRREPRELQDGLVTSISPGRSQGERVVVYIDERRAFDVAVGVADRAGLRAGVTLTADQQLALIDEDSPFRARDRAVRLLGVRDRSRREIETRLRQAGFEAGVIEGTLEWLGGLGYLDDARFARVYAAEKARTGWGPRRIRSELAGKGVERRVVDDVLAPLEQPDAGDDEGSLGGEGLGGSIPGGAAGFGGGAGDTEALQQVVRRRFARQFASDPQGAERRLAGFLARRGYDWETIGRMSRMLRSEAGDEGRSDGALEA